MKRVEGRFNPAWLIAAMMCMVPLAASAQTPRVEVQAEVVLASNKDNVIEPAALAKMKDKFAKSGLAFTSFRRLGTQKLTLESGKSAQMELPNGKKAEFKLDSVKEGTARVKVEVAKISTTVALGREGSVFIQAGEHDGGKLVLVLTPGGAVK